MIVKLLTLSLKMEQSYLILLLFHYQTSPCSFLMKVYVTCMCLDGFECIPAFLNEHVDLHYYLGGN